MPLVERDPNVGPRPASRTSVGSKTSIAAGPDGLRNPGVLSMLRTSTETVAPMGPRNNSRRSHSRLSGSSGYVQFPSDIVSPMLVHVPNHSRDAQSFSHGSKRSYSLSNQPSYSSLRSNHSLPRSSSPLRYPTRLRRPGVRPVSPALSDFTGLHSSRTQVVLHSHNGSRTRITHTPRICHMPDISSGQAQYPELRQQPSNQTLNPSDFSGPGPMIYEDQSQGPAYEMTQCAELPAEDVKIEPIELPAEPVGKRLTRAMVMEALQSDDLDDRSIDSHDPESSPSSREFKRESTMSETPSTSNTVCSLTNRSRSTLTSTITKPSLHEADSRSTLARTLKNESHETAKPSSSFDSDRASADALEPQTVVLAASSPVIPQPEKSDFLHDIALVNPTILDAITGAAKAPVESELHAARAMQATRNGDTTVDVAWTYNRSFAISTYSIDEVIDKNISLDRPIEPVGARHQIVSSLSDVREESFEDESRPPSAMRPSLAIMREEILIPSLDFSQLNLVNKLQEAFDDPRVTDILDSYDQHNLHLPIEERPSSLRERYKSFFANLDELDRPTEQTPTLNDIDPHNVLGELAKLSIPSVTALTQRLSEFLPSFRRGYVESPRPLPAVASPALSHEKSSSRLRPLPGMSDLIVMDDNVFELLRRHSSHADAMARCNSLTDSDTPSHAWARVRTPSTMLGDDTDFGTQLRRLTKRASPKSSPGDGRPWNHDKYYPWALSAPDIDLHLPEVSHSRNSSNAQTTSSPSVDDEQATRPVSLPASAKSKSAPDDPNSESRQAAPSRRSVIGTLKDLLPGDRYPTTGLAPPSGLILDEVRSYFSDDSSHNGRGGTLRRKITNLKVRIPMSRGHSMDKRPRTEVIGTQARVVPPTAETVLALDEPQLKASGMSSVEFHVRKLAQRVKLLWYRSNHFGRCLGLRTRSVPPRWSPQSQNMAEPHRPAAT